MLASRRRANAPRARQPRSRAWARRSAPVSATAMLLPPRVLRRLHVLLLARAPLVPRLRGEVRLDVVLRHEQQTRVRRGRRHQPTRELVKEQLDDRVEALQVELLVDREVKVTLVDQLERRRQEVVAAAVDALAREAVLLHRLCNALRAPRVDGEHPLQALVTLVVGFDLRQLLVDVMPSGNLAEVDRLARVLNRLLRSVD